MRLNFEEGKYLEGYRSLFTKILELRGKSTNLKSLWQRYLIIIQNSFSTLCGEYCFFFAYHLSRNINLKNVINFFRSDSVRNDQNIKHFVLPKFPGHKRNFTNVFCSEQNK